MDAKNNTVEIKLTNAELINKFYPALNEIGFLPIEDITTIVVISKLKIKLDVLISEYNNSRKMISEGNCKKSDDGKPVMVRTDDGETYTYSSSEDRLKTLSLLGKLAEEEIEFSTDTINVSVFNGVKGLVPNMISGVEKFINLDI